METRTAIRFLEEEVRRAPQICRTRRGLDNFVQRMLKDFVRNYDYLFLSGTIDLAYIQQRATRSIQLYGTPISKKINLPREEITRNFDYLKSFGSAVDASNIILLDPPYKSSHVLLILKVLDSYAGRLE